MFRIKDGFRSIGYTLRYLQAVNRNPDLPESRNLRQGLRRWRKRLGELWQFYQSERLSFLRHNGIAWTAILEPTTIIQGVFTPGQPLPTGNEIPSTNLIFFQTMTELLVNAAAEEP